MSYFYKTFTFEPGDFDGNAHRGTRQHSIQSFGGTFLSRTVLIEDCNSRNCVADIYSLK